MIAVTITVSSSTTTLTTRRIIIIEIKQHKPIVADNGIKIAISN